MTIQFHGSADLYTLEGATAVATLYSDPTTPTPNPAVTIRTVGVDGGQAAAFVFDLARSVVETRQGNPSWAGEERDGVAPIRPDDLFFGAAQGDEQPDWVNLDKVAVPQADEQQRLLANLIELMNTDRKPLPRFWYFPRGEKAVVIMSGDDHGNGGTVGRFDQYLADSPPGCSVADWECVRSSSYIYPGTPITDAQAAAYTTQGFEIGLHVYTGCADWTPASLETDYADQLDALAAQLPSNPPPDSERTHCIAWSDWATQPKVELRHGIRLDTNYYYWPPTWLQDRPGMFTGSGMPMRFADLDGTMIDVYQATTQMTDESGQSYPFTINRLLDRGLGFEGYYGAFTANMHTDSPHSPGSDAIVASARARGVPIVSGRQMLQWLDGRNSSSFGSIAWDGSALTFTVSAAAGANGLEAMVPAASRSGTVSDITRGGTEVTYAVETIKGIAYATFPATAGAYRVVFTPSQPPPTITSFSPTSGKAGTAVTITGTGFTGATAVAFGGATASFAVASDTRIDAMVPVAAVTGPITVTTPAGTATSATAFTVLPKVTSFRPTSGPPGTVVRITGTGLTGATKVTFGGVKATFTVDGVTSITATVPAGARTGRIKVVTPYGKAKSKATFIVT
jgi:hypothetical protein